MKIRLILFFLSVNSVLFSQELQIFQANQEKDVDFFDYEDYEGEKYKDTAISLLMFDGIGVH